MTEGIIFDMDGLLFATEEVYYQSTQQVADALEIPYSREFYLNYLGISDAELFENYYRDFAAFGREKVDQFIKQSYDVTYDVFDQGIVPVKKGAEELLKWAKEQNIPCVVASSNARSAIETLLDRAGLTDYFAAIFSAEDVTLAKPDPEIVEKAAGFFKTEKKNLVMLEDSLNGLKASNAAGVPVFLVPDLMEPTIEMENLATKVFPDLLAVKDYLANNN
ncbi:HAD family hydrolase [Enterococcus timonensis]|uniref:HAD family hydrolase n=1 Tax=Enterococcus timonensis TaxID=1852364 RepID=UPI0008DACF44|nr:HAD family phosphatase [Enterococcus timonensis]